MSEEFENVFYPPCKYCGHEHGMGIEDMSTGIIKPIDICYPCLWHDFNERNKKKLDELYDFCAKDWENVEIDQVFDIFQIGPKWDRENAIINEEKL